MMSLLITVGQMAPTKKDIKKKKLQHSQSQKHHMQIFWPHFDSTDILCQRLWGGLFQGPTSSAGETLNFPLGMGNPLPNSFEAISAPYSTVTSSSMAPTKRQNSFSTSSVGTICNEPTKRDIQIWKSSQQETLTGLFCNLFNSHELACWSNLIWMHQPFAQMHAENNPCTLVQSRMPREVCCIPKRGDGKKKGWVQGGLAVSMAYTAHSAKSPFASR